MAAAGYYVFMETLHGGQHVQVPNIVDLPITEASFILAEHGLELGKQTQITSSTVPKYHIIAQRPVAGRVVRTGRKIYPTVSIGEEFLNAPDLRNTLLEDARREITQSRFRMGTVARIPHSAARDTVLAQDPPPKGKVPNQGSIHLLVSAGIEKQSAFMPDLRGLAVEDVLRLIAPYGVTLVPNEVDIEGAQMDVVLDQDPPPNTPVYEGQVVTYDVKPSGVVVLPDARHQAEVRHRMFYDWYDKDVRVDVVDRHGNRQTAFTKPPLYDDESKRTYISGSTIRIPVTYIGDATVEVYINDVLEQSYLLKEGGEPTPVQTERTPAALPG